MKTGLQSYDERQTDHFLHTVYTNTHTYIDTSVVLPARCEQIIISSSF